MVILFGVEAVFFVYKSIFGGAFSGGDLPVKTVRSVNAKPNRIAARWGRGVVESAPAGDDVAAWDLVIKVCGAILGTLRMVFNWTSGFTTAIGKLLAPVNKMPLIC
jgi:hypothetical protein